MNLLSDKDLKRSRRAIYHNVAFAYIMSNAMFGFLRISFYESLLSGVIFGFLNGLVYYFGSVYVSNGMYCIDEYEKRRNLLIKEFSPKGKQRVKKGQ